MSRGAVNQEIPGQAAAPRWPWIVGLAICTAGLAVASYLTYAHFAGATSLACPDTGFIDCAKVTTSSYSRIFGIPVALLGLLFFVAMLPLQTPWSWRSTSPLLRRGRLAACAIGVGLVLWLVYVELFRLDSICIYCTAVHMLTFALFATVALATVSTAETATA